MSSSGLKGETYVPFDFERVNAVIGGHDKPIFTRERLDEAREQLASLKKHRRAKIHTVSGDAINITIEDNPNDGAFRLIKYERMEKDTTTVKKKAVLNIPLNETLLLLIHTIFTLSETLPPRASGHQNFPKH